MKQEKGVGMNIRDIFSHLIFSILCLTFSVYAKKIILTGGAGFIGSHVAEKLLQRGDFVIIIDNINDAYDSYFKDYNLSLVKKQDKNNNLVVYKADICDFNSINAIFEQEKPDIICHLAARAGVRTSIEDPQEYFRTNNNGTLMMFEMARKFDIKHVVAASSSSVYGVRQNGPFRETDPVEKQSSPYGMTKRAGELLAYVYYHLFGISSTNLRFFTVYGPRGRMDMAPFIFMDAIYNNKPITVFGDGSAIRDFTYVGDIVDGIVRSIDNPLEYQIVNLARGEPIVLSDFIKIIENVVGRNADIEYNAPFSGDVPQTHADVEKAQRLLGYQPRVSIAYGLEKMYEWYVEEYLSLVGHKKINSSRVYVFVE